MNIYIGKNKRDSRKLLPTLKLPRESGRVTEVMLVETSLKWRQIQDTIPLEELAQSLCLVANKFSSQEETHVSCMYWFLRMKTNVLIMYNTTIC